MKLKVICLGLLPKEMGGKITTGLSNVMWQIANGINVINKKEIEVIFVTSSINNKKKVIEDTLVYGMNYISLIKFSIINPLIFIKNFINVLKFCIKYNQNFLRSIFQIILLEKIYYKENPDIIHLHTINSCFLFLCTSFVKNVKSVVTIHGITGQDDLIENYKINKKMESDFSNLNWTNIIFVSSLIKQEWTLHYNELKSQSDVILNGINEKIFHNKQIYRKDDKIKLVCIGSIIPRKGQERIIKAIIKSDLSNKFSFKIIGDYYDKNYYNHLKTLIVESKIDATFIGYQNSTAISNLLNNSDFLILPSSSEGFGLVFIESILCGTPVIIPKDLPINKEEGILNSINSIVINDDSVESIIEGLNLSLSFNTDRYSISKTCTHLTSSKVNMQYYNKLKSLAI